MDVYRHGVIGIGANGASFNLGDVIMWWPMDAGLVEVASRIHMFKEFSGSIIA